MSGLGGSICPRPCGCERLPGSVLAGAGGGVAASLLSMTIGFAGLVLSLSVCKPQGQNFKCLIIARFVRVSRRGSDRRDKRVCIPINSSRVPSV